MVCGCGCWVMAECWKLSLFEQALLGTAVPRVLFLIVVFLIVVPGAWLSRLILLRVQVRIWPNCPR